MESSWSARRRFTYGLGFVVLLILFGLVYFRTALFPEPTCFDQKQNGYEGGVDCGGSCSIRCTSSIIPLSVSWARALPIGASTYDLAGLVANRNVDSAPRGLSYTFVVRDADGNVLTAIEGVTAVPINGDFPIVAKNVMLTGRPSSVELLLKDDVPYYAVFEQASNPTLRVTSMRYEEGTIPRLYATITNTRQLSFKDVPVRAVLYDELGNAFAVGQSVIRTLGKEGVEDVVFTWNEPFKTVPTKIRVYPILDPFSVSP